MPTFIFLFDDGTSIVTEAHCRRCCGQRLMDLDLLEDRTYGGWLHECPRSIPEPYHDRWLSVDETEAVLALEEGRLQ